MRGGDGVAIALVGCLAVGVGAMIMSAPARATSGSAPTASPAIRSDDRDMMATDAGATKLAERQGGDQHVRVRIVSSRNAPPVRDADEIRRRLIQGAPGTYIGDIFAASDSELVRWPDGTLLRTWIAPTSDVSNWSPAYVDVARGAFDAWSGGGAHVRVEYVRDSASAGVHVRWVERFPSGSAIGQTRQTWDQHRWLVAGDIAIATHTVDGVPLAGGLVRATLLHEVGHLLGLDHSRSSADIMAAEASALEISQADLATLRLLYVLPPGSVRSR